VLTSTLKEAPEFIRGEASQTVANDEMTMPFGKHKGIKIKDLSLSYLNWLANSSNLRENLRAAVDQALLEQTKASVIADAISDDVPWI
jgi:hypothetical protein